MISSPWPVFVPAPVRRRRKRRGASPSSPPPPPPPGIMVVSATRTGEFFVDFSFSLPVTSIGGAGNAQIIVETGMGPETPSASSQVNPTTVRFQFDSGIVSAGHPWSIDAVPDGLDFHGETFIVPQAGVIG